MDGGGGASFVTIATKRTRRASATTLVAVGKSHLSYFYVAVCSSVLYVAPGASNDAVLFRGDGDAAVALEVSYHKPARAADLRWATRAFVERNLEDGEAYGDLPDAMRRHLAQFNSLYENVKPGDRYLLSYVPGNGMSLSLNGKVLGSVGTDLRSEQQRQLARLIYSVWFGGKAPFAESMKRELLTPLEEPQCDAEAEVPPLLATSGHQKSSGAITNKESDLLDSLGVSQFLKEEDSSQQQLPDTPSLASNNQQPSTSNARISSKHSERWPSLAPIRNVIFPRTNDVDDDSSASTSTAAENSMHSAAYSINKDETKDQYKYSPILLGLGGAAFLLSHLAVLLSLPPVLRCRGAPYLPTFGGKQDSMFELIRRHASSRNRTAQRPLRFVDLGSGDGRVVFRAAREGLFSEAAGYEINPALHLFASCRRMLAPRYWSTTNFYRRDLWKTQLRQYDVVAVYGLSPIMGRLGKKLEEELRPGSIVVSNVFVIPGWRASNCGGQKERIHLYRVPDCFGKKAEGGI